MHKFLTRTSWGISTLFIVVFWLGIFLAQPAHAAPAAGQIEGTCVGWPSPHVEIVWHPSSPPGALPPNSNSILRNVNGAGNSWFFGGGSPGVYGTRISGAIAQPWGAGGYPNPNYTVYDLRDNVVQAGYTYSYQVKYRPETPSSNTYMVLINAENCGAVPPAPTPTPISDDGRIFGTCTWNGDAPQVNLSWSQNPPPGQTSNSNSLQKGDCFPSDPGSYWCFLPNDPFQYSYTDTAVLEDTQYQYRVKYRPDLSSVNTYNIYTSGANCGAPPPVPGPLTVSPTFQTVPPNVTALFSAIGGDGFYAWTAEGEISGSGSEIGVVFINNLDTPITRTVTVTSGNQTATATVQVDGIQTFQDEIFVRELGNRYVLVNDDAPQTSSLFATLTLAHGFPGEAGVTMKIGNTLEAAQVATAIPYQQNLPWNLCEGLLNCEDGMYTAFAIYQSPSDPSTQIVLDNIIYLIGGDGTLPTISINGGAITTTERLVTLTLESGFPNTGSDDVSMRIANSREEVDTAPPTFFSPTVIDWDLCAGTGSLCSNGPRSVFVRFCYRGTTCKEIIFDSIDLNSPWPDWGVRINEDAPATTSNTVQLRLNPWFNAEGVQVFLSNTQDFALLASASYADTMPWDICAGLATCDIANYTVYVRYIDGTGGTHDWPTIQSPRYEDEIALSMAQTPAGILINAGAQTATSRLVGLTFTSPFGAGPDVSMRPVNESGLSARDREIIRSLGGGIDSQPQTAPGQRLTDITGGDGVIPELDSGTVRRFAQQLGGWDLCGGALECPAGTYKVFVQYYRSPSAQPAPGGTLSALGDEVSGVYFDTITYTLVTPTPTISPTPSEMPAPTITPAGATPPGGTSGDGDAMGFIEILGSAGATIGLVAVVSSIAVIVPALLTVIPLVGSAGVAALAFAWQWFMGFIGLLPKRKHVWGTVYDSATKRPIPFAKVQLLDRNKRVLETRIADKDGRYGFLTTPESLTAQNVEISLLPDANAYAFPSHATPSVDTLIYNNLYYGGLITVSDNKLINYDIPMDPLRPSSAPLVMTSPSIVMGASVAAIADGGFWLGVIMVPLNFIISPNPFTLGVLFLFFGTASLRIWGISEHPFGVVKDVQTGRPMPFALITLNDLSGRRVAFTVTDEQGRYFLVIEKGTYELNVFTPATIQPGRQTKSTIDARKGWITRELKL